MILGFDTETTGLPDWRSPSHAEHQPHLVQLAMVLLDDDLTERASVSLIIKPDGWVIPPEVVAIHGITTDLAQAVGVPEAMATKIWAQMVHGLRSTVVGHNTDFDLRIMRIAMLRAGYEKDWLDSRKPEAFCTMKTATPIVNIPPTDKMRAAGFNKPKNASLSECIQHFFGEPMEGAHDAMVDVRACLRVYRHLMSQRPVEGVGDIV